MTHELRQKPWRFRHAFILAACLFSMLFVISLTLSVYLLQGILAEGATLRSALGKAAAICAIMGICAMVSAMTANDIVSRFLRCKLERAVPYHLLMEWVGSSSQAKILALIRLHELHVYIARPQHMKEVENLPCRLMPLYMLPMYDASVRWALRLFEEVYFDLGELEALFDDNLDTVRRAQPGRLMKEGSLDKKTEARLKITLSKEKGNNGADGRLENMRNLNEYCRLHAYTITLMAQRFPEKWAKRKTESGKVITHKSIQKMTGDILAEQPALKEKLLGLGVKGSPWLPSAMEDFFRHAMPDEMVNWGSEKLSLEYLVEKYSKGKGDVSQEDDPADDEQNDA